MNEYVDFARTLFHEPVSVGNAHELYGRNWSVFSEYLQWSRGRALILMHPVFSEEKSDIESLQKTHPMAELFHRVCSQTVQTIQKAQRHMPVLVYASARNPDQFKRTASNSREAITQTLQSLAAYGYTASEPMFIVPTTWHYPDTFEPLSEHVQHLEAVGLSYAVLGGMYFRLDRNPMYDDTYHPIGQHNHSKISEMIERDHQHRVQSPNYPHPFTLVAPDTSNSCLGQYADHMAHYTTIRFRFGRGLTYPDPIPRPGAFQRTKSGYELNTSAS